MIRTILLTALALAIALVGGAGSVWYALNSQDGVGAVTVGAWTAYPDLGSPEADPYSKARVAREGLLALGRAEGVTFVANRDSAGGLLQRGCDYSVEGAMPPARFWTLYAAEASMSPVALLPGATNALHSQRVVRLPGDIVAVTFSAHPRPGNWIATPGQGPFLLLLTFYDTSIASGGTMTELALPQVLKGRCDG